MNANKRARAKRQMPLGCKYKTASNNAVVLSEVEGYFCLGSRRGIRSFGFAQDDSGSFLDFNKLRLFAEDFYSY